MKDESRLFLEEVVKNYPKSDAAKEAKVQLAELDKAKRSRSGKKK
jgi:TolA-binding protein